MTGEYLVEISPDGFFCSAELGESTLKWPAFSQIRGTPDALYFYRSRRSAMIIPRRAFAAPDEADALLQAAAQWHAASVAMPVR